MQPREKRTGPGAHFNVIDLGVIIGVILLGYGLLVAQRIFSGKLRKDPPETAVTVPRVMVRVEVLLHNVDQNALQLIRAGDKVRDPVGHAVGKIIKTGQPRPDVMELIFGTKAVHPYHPTKQAVPVLMDLIGEARGQTYFFEGGLIGVGSEFQFQMPNYQVSGSVIRVLWRETEDFNDGCASLPALLAHATPVTATLLIRNVVPEEERVITVGDRVTHDSGVVMAKILSKKLVAKPIIIGERTPSSPLREILKTLNGQKAQRSATTEQSNQDTETYDLRLGVELMCIRGVNDFEMPFFGKILVGKQLTLQFPSYIITGSVVAIGNSTNNPQ